MIRRDERGVTAPLEYVYTFALATILITGIIIAATNAAGTQRQQTAEAQMEVIAQQVAGSLEDVDRLVHSSDGGVSDIRVEHELPDDVLGGSYQVTVRDGGSGTATITVTSTLTDTEVTTTAELQATTIPGPQTLDGGPMEVIYGMSANDLEVEDV